jgi:hypothetical protein
MSKIVNTLIFAVAMAVAVTVTTSLATKNNGETGDVTPDTVDPPTDYLQA